MKEREDQILNRIRADQEFNMILNKIHAQVITDAIHTVIVGDVSFKLAIGVGTATILINGFKAMIQMDKDAIVVESPKIPGKRIKYDLKSQVGIPSIVTLDILAEFVKPI